MPDNIIELLRAKKVKRAEINDGVFVLKKNKPKVITQSNNNHNAKISEEQEDEHCYIHSEFTDDSFAMIGNEFCLNFMDPPKKVDMSYYYFNKSKSAAYLYDMKKSFVEIDVILHLYEQWKFSIYDAKYCINMPDEFTITDSDIHIGVITENNDIEVRNKNLREILYPAPSEPDIPNFIQHKRYANRIDLIEKAKVLTGFDEGKVTIRGITYNLDVRTFKNKEHHMFFKDGVLLPQQESYDVNSNYEIDETEF